jgi:uncharacterized membrane protein
MKDIHLIDEVLQAFLLNETNDNSISNHLAACSTCKKRLEEYQLLFDSVKEIKAEVFSFELTSLAMNSIMLYERKKTRKETMFYWGLLVILLLTISSFSIPYIPSILSIFSANSIFTTLLVIITGLVVLLFLFADLILEYNKKKQELFENILQPTI